MKMNLSRVSFLVFGSLIIFLCLTPSSAQIKDRKLFDAIPVSERDRERLISRLNLYVNYLLTNQRAKLETLYDEATLCGLCKGNCTRDCAPPMLAEVPEGYTEIMIAFMPRAIKPDREPRTYAIEVEEHDRVSWKGKPPFMRKTAVHVYAIYERGDWYFSLVAIPGTVLM